MTVMDMTLVVDSVTRIHHVVVTQANVLVMDTMGDVVSAIHTELVHVTLVSVIAMDIVRAVEMNVILIQRVLVTLVSAVVMDITMDAPENVIHIQIVNVIVVFVIVTV